MFNRLFVFPVLLFVFLSGMLQAQVKTNLELFYMLADSSAASLKGKDVCLKINNSGQYSVLNNTAYKSAELNGVKNCQGDEGNFISLSFDRAQVKYPEMFRDGFLGAHLVKREISLAGNFYSAEDGYREFSYSYADTLRVDEVKDIEDPSVPFSKGDLPAEPFFSGLLEPAAAIGTAAAIIILYFTVRSK